MKKLLFAMLLFPFLGIGQSSSEQLTNALEQSFRQSAIPGMAVAIVNKDSVLYQQAFGYADIATKKPYTPRTIHNIGSISKTFIGIALLQLVEAGKLDLDVDINKYLPFQIQHPRHPNTPITLRQLSTHTAAIRDTDFNYNLRAYVSDDTVRGNRKGLPLLYKIQFKRMLKNEQISLGEFLKRTLSKKGKWYRKKNFYKHPPGTVEEYTNIGAALAGYIIEIVSDQNYGEYVKQHILQPLGMDASGWTLSDIAVDQLAERYIGHTIVPNYRLITYPDGGLISSTKDLSTYLRAIIKGYDEGNNILSADAYARMLKNQYALPVLATSAAAIKSRRGIFWDIYGETGTGDIGHSGSDPGIVTFMYFNPATGVGCVLTTNVDSHKKQGAQVIDLWRLLIKHRKAFE